jgi:hypothetical protein
LSPLSLEFIAAIADESERRIASSFDFITLSRCVFDRSLCPCCGCWATAIDLCDKQGTSKAAIKATTCKALCERVEVNDKLIEKPSNNTNREILEENATDLQRQRMLAR